MGAAANSKSPWAVPEARGRDRDREVKREAVLRTAARLFNEKGFHATSLDDVAERLEVTKPTLYYYVASKDEILFECVRIGLQMLHDGIEQSRLAGGSAIDQLVACMRTYARIVTMDFGMCLIRTGEDPLQPDSRKKLRHLKAGIDLEFRRLIELGIAEGALASCDPKLAAFTIAGALSWIGRWYSPDGAYTADEVADHCIALLLNGALLRDSPATPASAAPRRRASPGRVKSARV